MSYAETLGWYLRGGVSSTPRFVPLVLVVGVAVAFAGLIYWLTT